MSDKFTQCANAFHWTSVIVAGNVEASRFLHQLNAEFAIMVQPFGMGILGRSPHLQNANSSILLIVSGRVMLVIFPNPSKA